MTVTKYILFCFIATGINLIVQFFVLQIVGQAPYSLYMAMLLGTVFGLIAKYLMDKHYIFVFETQDRLHDLKCFWVYSCTGVFTTLIFWTVEVIFNQIFDYYWAKYLGAIIGLSIGYAIKFNLDRKYVFRFAQ